MKGVILAGGNGTRLNPLTKVTNKHLLPVYDKPLIYYPINAMASAGITDIIMILSGNMVGDCMCLLGSGKDLGVNLTYKCHDSECNQVNQLWLARDFVDSEQLMVIAGDSVIVGGNQRSLVREFLKSKAEAGLFLKEVPYPERYGVADIKGGKVKRIEEKVISSGSNYAITGIYLYKPYVFQVIEKFRDSADELNFFKLNNYYIARDSLEAYYLRGYWINVTKFESLFRAAMFVREEHRKNDS